MSINNCVFYFPDGNFFTYTRHEPVGVCGQILPVSWSSIQFSILKKKQVLILFYLVMKLSPAQLDA